MKEQQKSNGISSGVIAAVSAAVIALGGGVAWFTLSKNPVVPGNESSAVLTNEQPAEIYWLQDTGKSFKLVPQQVKVKAAGKAPKLVLEAAFRNLLAGPTEGTGSTTIPQGTQLEGVKVENDGVHVNLSEEFTTGGGSSSMIGRLGQVVYTATSLEPNAKVYIEVNGKQLNVLGSEGLELEQPLTRDSFNKNYEL